MKICIIIDNLNIGGGQINLLTLLKNGLNNENITIISLNKNGNLYEQFKYLNIPIIELNRSKRNPITIYFLFFRILNQLKPDVIHAILSGSCSYGVLYKIFHNNVRLILHLHSGFDYLNRRRRLIDSKFWRLADKIVVPCKYTKIQYKKYLSLKSNKIKVIYNGVEFWKYKNIPITVKENIAFGIFARLHPIKGHKILLDAFSQVIKDFPKTRLFIFGDGPVRSELEDYTLKLGCDKNVVFAGYVDNIIKVFSKINICVLPSLSEQFPISILEAFAAGRPVIASQVGGIPEVLIDGKHGFLFPVGDVTNLKKNMLQFLNNPKLIAQFGSASRKQAKHYNIKINKDQIINLYRCNGRFSQKTIKNSLEH